MAHPEQRVFFELTKQRFPQYFTGVSVLEIGSLNINGTVRDFYNTDRYLGVDVSDGPGVDMVAQGQNLAFPDNSFDVAVSAECFEHNPHWLETFVNMHRIATKFVIFTCATDGRPEHGTTRTTPEDSPFTLDWDYYRNLTELDFTSNLDLDSMFNQHEFTVNHDSHDLYFWGIK
jgi:SAM-dependent methyltransferase